MHLESKTTTGTFHTCLISNRNHLLNKQVCISNAPPQATKKPYSRKSTKLPTNDTLKLKNTTTSQKTGKGKLFSNPWHLYPTPTTFSIQVTQRTTKDFLKKSRLILRDVSLGRLWIILEKAGIALFFFIVEDGVGNVLGEKKSNFSRCFFFLRSFTKIWGLFWMIFRSLRRQPQKSLIFGGMGRILHACFPKLLKSCFGVFSLGTIKAGQRLQITLKLELFHHSTTFSEVGWGRESFAQIMGFSHHFWWSLNDLADHYIHSICHIHMDVCTYPKVTSQRRKNVI